MNQVTLAEAKALVCDIVMLERLAAGKSRQLAHFLNHEASPRDIEEINNTARRFTESTRQPGDM